MHCISEHLACILRGVVMGGGEVLKKGWLIKSPPLEGSGLKVRGDSYFYALFWYLIRSCLACSGVRYVAVWLVSVVCSSSRLRLAAELVAW